MGAVRRLGVVEEGIDPGEVAAVGRLGEDAVLIVVLRHPEQARLMNRSPAWCPWVSFMVFRPFRSMTTMAKPSV